MKISRLVKSTSGVRGVIGKGLDPLMITAYGAAFGTFLKKGTVVIGSDSRPSGEMVRRAVVSGLLSVGIDTIDIGIVPTPTVGIAIRHLRADGGICLTASHNPAEWNAMKFFNRSGEFITPSQYRALDRIFSQRRFAYKSFDKLGTVGNQMQWVSEHVRKILSLRTIDKGAIRKRRFRIAVDAINGAGSEALPVLLERLGANVIRINCNSNGDFVHGPEPVAENLEQLARAVKKHRADVGMACDPDADRLALVDERGKPIGEELTLTVAVMEVLKKRRGATVVNLSTSRTTADVAKALGSPVYYSKVGEANVVAMMHKKEAVIGGEGNGGVIYPSFHAGRDALVAAALVLSALAREKKSLSVLVDRFPKYYNSKSKASLPDDFTARLQLLEREAEGLFGRHRTDRRDGLRFDFSAGWAHLRASRTEPVFRLIVETADERATATLRRKIIRYFR